jgi:5'-nucleotidase
MRFSPTSIALAALAFTSSVSSINIMLGNDDGFASAQLRETYRLLKAKGHNVVAVSEADNESGQGGRAVFTTNPKLTVPSEYGILAAGSPSIGQAPDNKNIW